MSSPTPSAKPPTPSAKPNEEGKIIIGVFVVFWAILLLLGAFLLGNLNPAVRLSALIMGIGAIFLALWLFNVF